MKNKFELPYNFDDKYFDYWKPEYLEYIDCIYLPIYNFDNQQHNTREEYNKTPKDLSEYTKHIGRIKSYNIPICILLQRNASMELVQKCIDLFGVYMFTLNDDVLAKQIKEKFGNRVYLRLSITRQIKGEDIPNLKMYDCICLPFKWNRMLDKLKDLPTDIDYTIIVNTTCLCEFSGCIKHWFSPNEKRPSCTPIRMNGRNLNLNEVGLIAPKDLDLFSKYIKVFKLQGRDYSSRAIFNYLERYIRGEDGPNGIDYNAKSQPN